MWSNPELGIREPLYTGQRHGYQTCYIILINIAWQLLDNMFVPTSSIEVSGINYTYDTGGRAPWDGVHSLRDELSRLHQVRGLQLLRVSHEVAIRDGICPHMAMPCCLAFARGEAQENKYHKLSSQV